MIAVLPLTQPIGAALWQKARNAMDVILHVGAHRCAVTSFQNYMRANTAVLSKAGIGFWGPEQTRSGLFHGLQPGPRFTPGRDARKHALGRVQLRCIQAQQRGSHRLIVSDQTMMGPMRANLRLGALYCGAGERMARFAEAFRDQLSDIVINIRSPELYWASALGARIAKGWEPATPALITRLAESGRSWRDVITDVACAAPRARVHVLEFERFAARPDAQLAALTGLRAPRLAARERLNVTPPLEALHRLAPEAADVLPAGTGRWMPFEETQRAILRETYADDLMWLAGGADGLAQLVDDPATTKAATDLPPTDMTRGRNHERRYRQMARAGRTGTARQAS